MWVEQVVTRVRKDELGTEDDIFVERRTQQARVEMAKMCWVWGRLEKQEVVGNERVFV
uniref:Translation initiation factor eIF-2B subunit gamma isoform X1 n=1 Tax=Rhizophora mucronata TaxID=61149 RepID=A0A2P2PPJ7_RHIMU